MNNNQSIKRLFFVAIVGLITLLVLKYTFKSNITLIDFIPIVVVLLMYGYKDLQTYIRLLGTIKKGVDTINRGLAWNVNYLVLVINPNNRNELIVKNDPLWVEMSEKKTYSNDKLISLLIADFDFLSKNRLLKNYLKDKTVLFQLVLSAPLKSVTFKSIKFFFFSFYRIWIFWYSAGGTYPSDA
ncbi:MAG: hypothetical protein ACK5A2_12135 [Bacteroidota bacterium]|jgi:hypothetical protein